MFSACVCFWLLILVSGLLTLHASTRTRTRNAPLEAESDFRFTIEAHVGLSLETGGCRLKKERPLNVFLSSADRLRFPALQSGRQGIRTLTTIAAARFSKPARQTLSGYLP